MLEHNNPEINVEDLMARVRAEVAKRKGQLNLADSAVSSNTFGNIANKSLTVNYL